MPRATSAEDLTTADNGGTVRYLTPGLSRNVTAICQRLPKRLEGGLLPGRATARRSPAGAGPGGCGGGTASIAW